MNKKQRKAILNLLHTLFLLISISIVLLNKLGIEFLIGSLIAPSIFTFLIGLCIPVNKKNTRSNNRNQSTTNVKKKTSGSDLLTADINTLSGDDFEKLICLYFEEKGFNPIRTERTGDHGVDIVITDPKDGFKIAVQCKRWKNTVGNNDIIKLHGGKSFYACQGTLFITTSNYTSKAKEFAAQCKMELWNGLHVNDKINKWRKKKLAKIS